MSASIRAVSDVIAGEFGVESFADKVDAALAPLHDDIPHAYAHFTAEVP
ncbi:hypothetical protein [Nocardia sp. NPDC051833]